MSRTKLSKEKTHKSYFTQLTGASIPIKLIEYLIDHPEIELGIRPLCRKIDETPAATLHYIKKLIKGGFILEVERTNYPRGNAYKLNQDCIYLEECKSIVKKLSLILLQPDL